MDIVLRMSTIPLMLGFLKDLKNGCADEEQIRGLLDNPDYDFECRRYAVSSKDALIRYFSRLNTIMELEILDLTPERKDTLREKHPRWLYAYKNPGLYLERYDKIRSALTVEALAEIERRVRRGLPGDLDIDTVDVVSTMSIGLSFGYVFEGALHFDLMGFADDGLTELTSLIAHEVHHLAMWKFVSAFINSLTPEERFIFNFTGEGLAIKFCNNAKGVFSMPVDQDRPVNEGLDRYSMDYLNGHFEESFAVFEDTLSKIRSGKMDSAEVFRHMEEYWWNPHTQEQSRDDAPLLKHSRMYSFGNDLFGTIYDAYGSEVLFDCVRHPLHAVEYFKKAISR